jgi:hypothetical protein
MSPAVLQSPAMHGPRKERCVSGLVFQDYLTLQTHRSDVTCPDWAYASRHLVENL